MKSPTSYALLVFASFMSLTASNSEAANVAAWQDSGNVTYLNDEITAAGQTPVTISAINSAGLSGVGILFLLNSSNSAYSPAMTGGAADLANFVSGGGTLVFFDRVAGNDNVTLNGILPGSFDFNIIRSLVPNLDLTAPGSPYLAGLSNTSFDGGNSAAHGYIASGNLPVGASSYIHVEGSPSQIVDFSYSFGAGMVHYSTIPADFYAGGAGSTAFQSSVNLYVQNLASVPEPGSAMLSAIAMLGLLARRRR
jgi:hypothetical protein